MDKEHSKLHHAILDNIIEILETQIYILKKLNKLEKKLTSHSITNKR
jgi:hypothetical protein